MDHRGANFHYTRLVSSEQRRYDSRVSPEGALTEEPLSRPGIVRYGSVCLRHACQCSAARILTADAAADIKVPLRSCTDFPANARGTSMEEIQGGSIISPAGFRVGSSRCGIRQAEGKPDVALLVADAPASAAGVFTTNRFAAAPVEWCCDILPGEGLRAVVINAGNANACTGEQGREDVRATARRVAGLVNCDERQVVVCSTGVIGRPLPMHKLLQGVSDAFEALSPEPEAARSAERAIMTTDTVPKACAVRSWADGKTFHVGGMAKGAGMISPNLATMLVILTTDAGVPARLLQRLLKDCADSTFNAITVDGDTSTNDSVVALASGASGLAVEPGTDAERPFCEALHYVMHDLALKIVRDGEGATKLVEVRVSGAASREDAQAAARAIADSLLVKCAIHGGDPNWGRIVCAAGYSGARFDPARASLAIGQVQVFAGGTPTGADASGELSREEVRLHLDLGSGQKSATVWTCDLSEEYVQINAEYHT